MHNCMLIQFLIFSLNPHGNPKIRNKSELFLSWQSPDVQTVHIMDLPPGFPANTHLLKNLGSFGVLRFAKLI